MSQTGYRSFRNPCNLPYHPYICRHATKARFGQSSTSASIPPPSAPTGRNPPSQAPTSPIQPQYPSLTRQRQAKQWPPSDAGIKWIALGGLIGVPIISYFWYNHRKEHMYNKKHQLLREAQARYQANAQR